MTLLPGLLIALPVAYLMVLLYEDFRRAAALAGALPTPNRKGEGGEDVRHGLDGFEEVDFEVSVRPRFDVNWLAVAVLAIGVAVGISLVLQQATTLPVVMQVAIVAALVSLCLISAVDAGSYILPDLLTFLLLAALLTFLIALGVTTGDWSSLWHGVWGAVAFAGFMAITAVLVGAIKGGSVVGFGDIKLALPLGLLVAFPQPTAVDGVSTALVAIAAASVLLVFIGGGLNIIRKEDRAFPFGPMLCLGAWMVLAF